MFFPREIKSSTNSYRGNTYLNLGPVHTYPDKFETDKYLYGYGFRPHVNGVFTHRKRINLKTLSRVDKFENAG